jgi:hypothetical protein
MSTDAFQTMSRLRCSLPAVCLGRTDTSNTERCGSADVTLPIKHLPKTTWGELISNSTLNRELVSWPLNFGFIDSFVVWSFGFDPAKQGVTYSRDLEYRRTHDLEELAGRLGDAAATAGQRRGPSSIDPLPRAGCQRPTLVSKNRCARARHL